MDFKKPFKQKIMANTYGCLHTWTNIKNDLPRNAKQGSVLVYPNWYCSIMIWTTNSQSNTQMEFNNLSALFGNWNDTIIIMA